MDWEAIRAAQGLCVVHANGVMDARGTHDADVLMALLHGSVESQVAKTFPTSQRAMIYAVAAQYTRDAHMLAALCRRCVAIIALANDAAAGGGGVARTPTRKRAR
jgi:hypothetical protein